jgi:hypothetical protein
MKNKNIEKYLFFIPRLLKRILLAVFYVWYSPELRSINRYKIFEGDENE